MKPSTRLILTALLVAFCLVLLYYAFGNTGWEGALLFLAGVSIGLGALRIFSPSGSSAPAAPAAREEAAPALGSDERAVFVPGRNFEEMLERLGSNESMLNVILNSMGEGVILLNQADRVVLMNPSAEKILGTTEKESIGKLYLEVVRNPVLAELLTRSKREGGLSSGEMELGGKEDKTFAVSVAAIRAEKSQHLGQIVVFSDITSMKRLMRMRTDFVANVSHELKTPLTAILGYVETLIAGAIDDKKNRNQFLQKISDQAGRLHALITDVLELSKIESGGYITSLEPVDLAEVAQQAIDLLKAKSESKKVMVRQEISADQKVLGHRQGLVHVLENLLDNAIKYSPEKTEVRVFSARRSDGRVEFVVEDQGPGIPKEAQSRVFERFFRVDASRSREAGGTGLGLAIVKHLVEKMNGEVTLKSEEGKGSTFTVVLTAAPGQG